MAPIFRPMETKLPALIHFFPSSPKYVPPKFNYTYKALTFVCSHM